MAPYDELLTSQRVLGPRAAWLRLGREAACTAPLTSVYVIVLGATTAVVTSLGARSDARLLSAFSTNLHQLARVPIRVLVGSAFWAGGWSGLVLWAILLAAVVAPIERRLGSRRVLGGFAAAHVGATLLVAAGLWVGIRAGGVAPSVEFARDVGVSYGFFGVAGLAAYLLAPWFRACYVLALLGPLVLAVVVLHTFTDVGHLIAFAIGLACYPLVQRRSRAVSLDGPVPPP